MEEIIKALREHSEEANAIANLLYGDGAWEISKSLNSEGGESTKDKLLRGGALVGTAAGAALGATEIGHGLRGVTRAGGRLNKIATKIPKMPGGPKTQLGVAGTMLGADLLATSELKKPKTAVAKGLRQMYRDTQATTQHARRASAHAANAAASAEASAAKAKRLIPSRKVAIGAGVGTLAALGGSQYAGSYYGTKNGTKAGNRVSKAHVEELDIVWEGEISKVDDDKRQVFGWASVVSMGGKPVVDLQGDYMAMETIEKAAYNYVHSSRKGGDMHERNGDDPRHVSDLIESFVVTEEKKKLLGLPDEMPEGWLVGFQVHDDATWDLVKSGKRKGFSIHGSGKRIDHVLEDA